MVSCALSTLKLGIRSYGQARHAIDVRGGTWEVLQELNDVQCGNQYSNVFAQKLP